MVTKKTQGVSSNLLALLGNFLALFLRHPRNSSTFLGPDFPLLDALEKNLKFHVIYNQV